MNRDIARKLLVGNDAGHRLRAARWFSKNADGADFELLRRALDAGYDFWTQDALRAALASLTNDPGDSLGESVDRRDDGDSLTDEIYSEAVEETTSRLVHELEPIVGTLKVVASREVPDYSSSQCAVHIGRLENFLAALDGLRRASAAPTVREFDLATLVRRVAEQERRGQDPDIEFGGSTPLIVVGDPTLVELALANGLRNALEATRAMNEHARPVVVTWGDSDRDCWVSVLDEGAGLPPGKAGAAFDIGTTSKQNHLGMGLALAKQAVASLRGEIALRPRFPRGASYRFAWPRGGQK